MVTDDNNKPHPADALRSPEQCLKADPRQEVFGTATELGIAPNTLENHHREVAAITLHAGVPEPIQVQFETVRNLYLYAWFVYRFYPVARLQSYICLEFALRKRFEGEEISCNNPRRYTHHSLKCFLFHAIAKDYLRNEPFHRWRMNTEHRARERQLQELIQEMQRTGADSIVYNNNNLAITDEDRSHDYLGTLLDSIPWLRNDMAHGSTMLDNQSLTDIRSVAEIINQLYPLPAPSTAAR